MAYQSYSGAKIMAFSKILLIFSICVISVVKIESHGMAMDPVGRGSAWRVGFNTPPNYNDNENYCGGFGVHYGVNKGKCGACGDNYSDATPRPHENGGLYGTGTIVRTYKAGSVIDVTVLLTASHSGHFEFALCPLNGKNDIETDECFDRHPLPLASGGYKYLVRRTGNKEHKIQLKLPENFTCTQCSFRWHYRTGNSWGLCPDGTGANGCGNQEVFRTCSDITIE